MAFPVSPTEGQTFTENNTVWIYSAVTDQWNRSVINPLNQTTYIGSDGAPGGIGGATQVIFNDNGSLASDAGLVYNKTTDVLTTGSLRATSLGTAAAPGIAFETDPNTGIYSPGADQLAVATNGTGRLFVDASGNVGVGTGSSSERLRLGFTSTAQSALVFAPTAALNGGKSFISASASAARISGVAVNGVVINLNEASVNTISRVTSIVGSVNSGLSLDNRGGIVGVFGSAGLTSSHSTGHGYGVLGSSSDANTNAFGVVATLNSAGAYEGKAALLAAGSATGDVAHFRTSSSEAMRITAAGLVGIGTSAPNASLDVTNGGFQLTDTSSSFSASESISYYHNTSTQYAEIQFSPQNGGQGYIYFKNRVGGTLANVLTIQGSNVGIGTTSPVNALHINGAAGEVSSRFRLSSTEGSGFTIRSESSTETMLNVDSLENLLFGVGGGEVARIDTSGRLLVGTSTARSNFFNSSITAGLQVEGTGLTTARAAFSIVNNDTGSNPSILVLGKSGGATLTSNTLVASGNWLGTVSFQGADGSELVEAASVAGYVDGTPGTNDMPGRLVFSTTADGASSPTERLRITSTGQVRLAGAGITFNGDTAAANELDDYEEGTWTPSVGRTGTFGTYTAGAADGGKYTKIGNVVYYSVRVNGTNTTATGGSWVIRGLPFTSANNTSWGRTMAPAVDSTANSDFSAQGAPYVNANSTDILFGTLISGNNVYCAGFYYVS
jgi:hypothetical protein